jgi:hypothetical protein
MKTVWEKLAYCAEVDTGLPGSLMCDAWDLAYDHWARFNQFPMTTDRAQYERFLGEAVDAYLAAPVAYTFNPRSRVA